ncbi:MAG: YajG family lipoprotein [Acidiferrobacterales bacterium]|nr:YajG family lipoprotein [Acidiferrobacterales bacterium]
MKFLKLIGLLTFALSTTACVTGTREITLELPTADTQASKVGAIYIASLEDKRVFEQKPKKPEVPSVSGKLDSKSESELSSYVGRQRNGYGGAMGSVALAGGKTVQDEVRAVLSQSLESRGYEILSAPASDAKTIEVAIKKFWAWMVPGFVSVGFESEVELSLEANNKTAQAYGKGNNEGQVASNANWELTYKRAYQELLDNLEIALDGLGL